MVIVGFERANNDTMTLEAVDKLADDVKGAPAGSKVTLTGARQSERIFKKARRKAWQKQSF